MGNDGEASGHSGAHESGGEVLGSSSSFSSALRAAAKREGLTAADRNLVDALLRDLDLAAFGSTAQVAAVVGSSPATVVRSARRLGFDGWTQMQGLARSDIRSTPFSATERLRSAGSNEDETASLAGLADWVGGLGDLVHSEEFGDIVGLLADQGRSIWVASGHEGTGPAATLVDRLRTVRPGVRGIPGDPMASARALLGLAVGDLCVVVDRQRHDAQTVRVVEEAADSGAVVVGLLDTVAGPVASRCRSVLLLPELAIGPFDSYTPALVLVELLVGRVAARTGGPAIERAERLESTWDRWGLLGPG